MTMRRLLIVLFIFSMSKYAEWAGIVSAFEFEADPSTPSRLPPSGPASCSRTWQACSAELLRFPSTTTTTTTTTTAWPPSPAHATTEGSTTTTTTEGREEEEDVDGSGMEEPGGHENDVNSQPYANGHRPAAATELLSFPLYDELWAEQAGDPYDYQAGPDEVGRAELCSCPQQVPHDNNAQQQQQSFCGGGSADRNANNSFQMQIDRRLTLSFCLPIADLAPPCTGRRDLVRIIGKLDDEGALVAVVDTLLFCRCKAPAQLKKIGTEPWYNGGTGPSDKYALIYRCVWQPPPH